jgi:hypothetical protein
LQEPRDQWWLVCNVSGQKSAALLRKQMFDAGEIPHPHIGAWVSTQMPWSPPLCTPVGNWQNVYLVLTLGMFDSHYNPRQNFLRAALHPVIHAAWKAVSRQPFTKILYAPERSNVRFLPTGGQKLNWHVDASAIAPVCADDPPDPPFLADPRGSGTENDPIALLHFRDREKSGVRCVVVSATPGSHDPSFITKPAARRAYRDAFPMEGEVLVRHLADGRLAPVECASHAYRCPSQSSAYSSSGDSIERRPSRCAGPTGFPSLLCTHAFAA